MIFHLKILEKRRANRTKIKDIIKIREGINDIKNKKIEKNQ